MYAYGTLESPGLNALKKREKRAIIQVASNSDLSARTMSAEVGVITNIRNVQWLLKNTPTIKYQKHIYNRMEFGRMTMSCTTEWKKIMFSDEKKLISIIQMVFHSITMI